MHNSPAAALRKACNNLSPWSLEFGQIREIRLAVMHTDTTVKLNLTRYVSILSLQFRCNFAYSGRYVIRPSVKALPDNYAISAMILPVQSEIKYVNLSRYVNYYFEKKNWILWKNVLRERERERERERKKEIDITYCRDFKTSVINSSLAYVIFKINLSYKSNETRRSREYRSNLDRSQKLIPAIWVDEEKTVPLQS